MLPDDIKKKILVSQRNEITEYFIYKKLAQSFKNSQNKEILESIASDELKHYHVWKEYTKKDVELSRFNLWKYYLISKIFGITFGIKLMEKGEERAQVSYDELSKFIPEAKAIEEDENKHENELISLIDEERLKYVGSMVLGLNDALVELTGALAGFTFALQNAKLIAMTGLITGIAASFSMAASEYLSTKAEGGSPRSAAEARDKHPLKASVYTGVAYILTVFFLIFPYLIFSNYYFSLVFMLFNVILIIALFTFYVSIAQDISFKERFLEMAGVSLSVAVLSFGIGFLVRILLGIDV
jgi:VIT1/CCC1 family predicted Fe2+/Mn2+ transporter